jgi:hypothetical protein
MYMRHYAVLILVVFAFSHLYAQEINWAEMKNTVAQSQTSV